MIDLPNTGIADEVVFLDITASSEDRATMVEVVAKTADQVFIPLTVGGGVRTIEDARALLRAGADKVAVNTAAIARPEVLSEIAHTFGAQCVVIAVDVKRSALGFEVFSHGGRTPTGLDALEWVHHAEQLGAGEILLTSMDRDGTESGYDVELLHAVAQVTTIPIIASGGVGTLDHMVQGARAGADALLAASIFHYGQFSVAQVKSHLLASGVAVRPIGA